MSVTRQDDALPDLARILSREISVAVTVAGRKLPMSQLLDLRGGSLIEFDKPAHHPVDLQVNGLTIATGVAVRVGERSGLRVTRVADLPTVIRSLAGGAA